MVRLFSILMMIFFCTPVWAGDGLFITEIIAADRIQLSDDRVVSLIGVIPDQSARDYLKKQFLNKQVEALPDDASVNRHHEVMVDLKTVEGEWAQGALVREGLARVYTMPSFRDTQDALLRLEEAARTNKKGLWQDEWQVLNASDVGKVYGLQIIEGMVVDVVERGSRIYLNFGDDWREDFTISVMVKDHKEFLKEGFDVLRLKDQRIRIRGWVDHYNGPFIELTYPEQLEVL